MPAVKIPHDFFEKSKREYADWFFAFFRELIQNSYDAGATSIDFSYDDKTDGELTITCRDNGCGMSKDTLENVMLALGGSQKMEESVGGFGYAKTILYFAHLKYEILTKEWHVRGSGGQYDITKSDEYVDGTISKVTMTEEYPARWFYVEDQIVEIMKNSKFKRPVSFSLNGHSLEVDKPTFDFKFETELGTLRFSDSKSSSSKLWVQINGLAMFNHVVWNDSNGFNGILSLKGNSTDMLTSNRDGLNRKFTSKFNDIINKLSTERASLKSNAEIDFVINEKQFGIPVLTDTQSTEANEPKVELNEVAGLEANNLADAGDNEFVSLNGTSEVKNRTVDPFFGMRKKIEKENKKNKDKINSMTQLPYPKNFRIRVDSDDSKQPSVAQISKMLNQKQFKKMGFYWESIINQLLWALSMDEVTDDSNKLVGYKYKDKSITTGFVFNSEVEGLCSEDDEQISIFINPLRMKEFQNFDEIVDVAIHECTHIFVKQHNEKFSNLEIEIRRSLRRMIDSKKIKTKAQTSWIANS